MTGSGIHYSQLWSRSLRSPPSGCPPLRCSKPPGNGQGSVPVLARGKRGLGITSHPTGISACVFAHVSSVQTSGECLTSPGPLSHTECCFIKDTPCTRATQPVSSHTVESALLYMESERLCNVLSNQGNKRASPYIRTSY